MKNLIVITDLGRIRVVKFRPAGEDPIEQEHLLEDETKGGSEHVISRGEIVTDQSGRFGHGAAGTEGGMSYGEEHNLETEMERKAIEHVATRIAEIVAEEGYPRWSLAAPQPILGRLKSALPEDCRERLSETVGADLTKETLAKLERRFEVGRGKRIELPGPSGGPAPKTCPPTDPSESGESYYLR